MKTLIVLLLSTGIAQAEFCRTQIDSSVPKKGGYRWQWRTVDNKQCWFYSNRLLPKEDLIWAFSEEEFNRDIDRVIERKFYGSRVDD